MSHIPSGGNRLDDVDGVTGNNGDNIKHGGEMSYNGDNDIHNVAGPPTYIVPNNVDPTEPAKPKETLMTRMLHSFRRKDDGFTLNSLGQRVPKDDPEKIYGPGELMDGGELNKDTSRLNRKLKGRHLQMIAIGGAIGTGLFIGSGSALATGGPAALVLDFGIIGIMLFCVIHALGELAVFFPISGIISLCIF